ncbi:MAG: 4-oxalocrotonate tautomerase family protein [Nitrospira sp.]|nr:4-oxalocrotonate tautomerase family protein [Nitrospira sp.]
MPYVNMQVTREGVTLEQKEALIKGVTDLLVHVLNKQPAQTFIVIEEVDTDNWGIAGTTVTKFREQEKRLSPKSVR